MKERLTESLIEVDTKYVDLLNQIVKSNVRLREKGYTGKEGLPGKNRKAQSNHVIV